MSILNNIKTIKPEPPDKEILTAIENIKSTLIIQKENGNPNADFILRRMR
jgi:hypothetical protein